MFGGREYQLLSSAYLPWPKMEWLILLWLLFALAETKILEFDLLGLNFVSNPGN